MISMDTIKGPALALGPLVAKPIMQQVADYLRDQIKCGHFPRNARLPSNRQLAAELAIPRSTVNAAVSMLAREGWLTSMHGSGTFVRERPRQLRTIAIYYYGSRLCAPEARFYRALQQRLEARIEGAGRRWSVWTDPRPESQDTVPWRDLMAAAERQEFDALLVPATDVEHLSWLTKVQVPVAYVASAPLPNSVHFDVAHFADISLRALAEQGCRNVGLIAALSPQTANPDGSRHEHVRFLDAFVEQAGAYGLSIRDPWIVTPRNLDRTAFPSAERFGYEAFTRLWRHSPRPDGLVVWTDAEAQGVAMAITEQGVRVPEDLRLVFHKNAEVDLLCPFPVTLAVTSADEVARDLMALVERQFAGEEVQPLVVRCTLQKPGRQPKQATMKRKEDER